MPDETPAMPYPCRARGCGRKVTTSGAYCCWRCHDAAAYAPRVTLKPWSDDRAAIAALMHTRQCEISQWLISQLPGAHGRCASCGGPRALTRAALPGGGYLTALTCAGSCR